jgi:hypothetical protein
LHYKRCLWPFLDGIRTPSTLSILCICPLLLTFLSSREHDLIYFSIIATALTWSSFFLEPPGLSIPYGVLNRVIGTLVLWGVAMGLIHIRRVEVGLTNAEGALEIARKQFKGIFEAAMDASRTGESDEVKFRSLRFFLQTGAKSVLKRDSLVR